MGTPGDMLRAGLMEFGRTAVSRILSRPTVRSSLRGELRKLFTGSRERPVRTIAEVERAADHVAGILREKTAGVSCIGIDGIAGSGKSTLNHALSRRLGLSPRTLYARDVARPVTFEKGFCYENLRLLRTQRIDDFDAIIYLDVPEGEARERVILRDRSGALADFLDFVKLKRLGDLAFEAAGGEEMAIPDSAVKMKIRPGGGYRHRHNLAERLKEAGHDPGELSKEEMLFLLRYGSAQEGIRPYVKLGAYNRDILEGFVAGLLVALRKIS